VQSHNQRVRVRVYAKINCVFIDKSASIANIRHFFFHCIGAVYVDNNRLFVIINIIIELRADEYHKYSFNKPFEIGEI